MRYVLLGMLAAVALAGTAQAQTAAQPAATPPASTASSSSSSKPHLSHDCKKEVKKACGRAHGTEMQDCIKSSLDLNKFSDTCKSQLTAEPSG
jgi:TolA-binding protein